MCGITGGVWTTPEYEISPALLQSMIRTLRHRGPDDEGFYFWPSGGDGNRSGIWAALGHRRLAIIDIAGGKQPMANEDRTVWVVFNGEIYNFRELRSRLEAKGHRFASRSDTEVLVHLYEDVGPEMLPQLNGMFAFAIWDGAAERLFLARDRCGEKPLFYMLRPGAIFFASELKALLQLPFFRKEINLQAVDLYLTYQYVPHPHTIYQGVHKLPPGHYLLWEKGRAQIGRYWNPDFQTEIPYNPQEAKAAIRDLLSDAVRLRLESDVPLGAFLSGGIDSTIVVGLMRRHSPEPVHTFSIGFPVAAYDETDYAQEASRFLETVHHQYRVEPDALGILPHLVWHYDEPFADSSAIPTWYLAEKTRQHVTVALTGDGGDELFCGYPRYQAVRVAEWIDRLPVPLKRFIGEELPRILPHSARFKSPWRRLHRFLEQVKLPPLERYLEWIGIFPTTLKRDLYTPEVAGKLAESVDSPASWFLEESGKAAARRDRVSYIMLIDLLTYLPCDLMTKVDIASMAHGLECRQPFLDHRVIDFAAKLPLEAKLKATKGKRILREAFWDVLPPKILRRGKMGFGVPLDFWFRGPLRPLLDRVLFSARATARGLFRPEAVRRLIDEHAAGLRDHAARLWALLFLELWFQRWIDGQPAELPQFSP